MQRRQFLGFVSLAGLAAMTGGVQAHETGLGADEFSGAPTWTGTAAARPAPNGHHLSGLEGRIVYIATDTGEISYLKAGDDEWTRISFPANRVFVTDESDLPAPSGGVRTLDPTTAYLFTDFVTSQDSIDPNGAPMLGYHGALSGFIHTGAGTALTGTDSGLFMRNLYVHAPGGALFDLTADQSTEMLVESCAFSDAAGIGQLASFGTINGYRVPSFKGCNFEDFAGGLTFDGTPDKIFISGCPFRTVTASGVTILTFAGSLDVDIVDMPDNYVKAVQSDTEVIRVAAGGSPTDVFQYRGTVHDGTVTKANILTGEAGVGEVGYRVSNAYPLRDSAVVGELSLDSPTTTTITTQETYVDIAGATSLGNESTRVTQVSAGTLRYDGKKDTNVKITASVTLEGASNETYAVAIAKNGTVEPTSEAQIEGTGNTPVFVAPSGIEDLQTGDTISLKVKNIDGTSDVTVDLYNLNFSGL